MPGDACPPMDPPTREELAAVCRRLFGPGAEARWNAELDATPDADLVILTACQLEAQDRLSREFDEEMDAVELRLWGRTEAQADRITRRLLRGYLHRLLNESYALCMEYVGPTFAEVYRAMMAPRFERVVEYES